MFLVEVITMNTKKCLQIKKLINEADAIIIGAGAGLSASAGLDYSPSSFKKHFPELVKAYGMTDMYTSSFYEFNSPEERWSYWAKHINYSYISKPAFKTYQNLLKIVQDKEYFVITTNVDGQFLKAGFNPKKVFEVQGSYNKIQCSAACHSKTYDNTNLVKQMLLSKDNLKVPHNLVPYCPICGQEMTINIRKDDYFVEDQNWHNLNQAYENFLNNHLHKKIVLLELGVGFNTPGIIRFPFEQLASTYKNITLIRINNTSLETFYELKNNFISLKEDCSIGLKNLL